MMKHIKVLIVFFCLITSTGVLAQPIEGIWNSMVSTPMGELIVVFDFDQDGTELSGTMSMDMMPVTPISEGEIHDKEFSFKVTMQAGPGGAMAIKYEGKIDGDTMELTSTFEGEAPPGSEGEQKIYAVRTVL